MLNAYTTVAAAGRAEVVEKRSRFLAVAAPVSAAEEALALVQQARAEHHDARHHCFAYLLKGGEKRYSDDGEPQGTAGMPILDVLERRGVVDCAVVVTRYFGGTLLGTGGLVRAYSAAATGALDAAPPLAMARFVAGSLQCTYTEYGRIPAIIAGLNGLVRDSVFGADVTVTFYLPAGREAALCDQLREYTCGACRPVFAEPVFLGKAGGDLRVVPAATPGA